LETCTAAAPAFTAWTAKAFHDDGQTRHLSAEVNVRPGEVLLLVEEIAAPTELKVVVAE
jgi:hypothetical protein